jgi:hypothetical protein
MRNCASPGALSRGPGMTPVLMRLLKSFLFRNSFFSTALSRHRDETKLVPDETILSF